MNGIFGFGWVDTIVKLIIFAIIGLIVWIISLNCKTNVKGEKW